MAKVVVKGTKNIELMLAKLEASSYKIGQMAVEEGAGVVADGMRQSIKGLPNDTFRRLEDDENFSGVPNYQRKDLLDSMGISPTSVDENGIINAKVGFDGYGSYPTKKYPKGLPNALLARAIESGSSVRNKTPFVRPTIDKYRRLAKDKMQEVITRETLKIKNGG